MSSSSERLQQSRCLLLAHQPWYGHAAMNMTWLESNDVDTMGVRIVHGGEVQCLYNPHLVESLSAPEVCTVIQHEIEHVVRCHCIRVADRNPLAWNLAADMAVNGHCARPRIGFREEPSKPPAIPFRKQLVWVPKHWNDRENAERYYNLLLKVDQKPHLGRPLGDHSLWAQSDVTEAEMREVAAACATHATENAQGNVPRHLRRIVDSLAESNVPWQALLRRFVNRCRGGGRRPTYAKRNRRHDRFGIPGSAAKRHGRVAVVVDVSGSICRGLLGQFFAEVEVLCRHAQISVLLWDAAFQGFTPKYRRGDWRKIELRGGGGTDMAAPVAWLEECGAVGDGVVILTDGYCNWPEPRTFPLLAAISSTNTPDPPWGTAIRLAI